MGKKARTIEVSGIRPWREMVDAMKREYLLQVLQACGWHRAQTGEALGISYANLKRLMRLYAIKQPNKRWDRRTVELAQRFVRGGGFARMRQLGRSRW